MNTIAIIENDRKDFNSVKAIFKTSNVWPNDFSEFWKSIPSKKSKLQSNNEFEQELVSNICKKILLSIDDISAIIMDISLYSDLDESGLGIIKHIRNQVDAKYKLIPIFCYSRHGSSCDKRDKALAVGATNIFDKQDVGNRGKIAQRKIEEFQITMRAQMLAYEVSMVEINASKKLENIENTLASIRSTQIEDTCKLNITTEMLLSMMSVERLNNITNKEENEKIIEKIVGGKEQLEQMRQRMCRIEDKNNQAELFNDIADILSSIPGLNFVFPLVPKILSVIRKNTD